MIDVLQQLLSGGVTMTAVLTIVMIVDEEDLYNSGKQAVRDRMFLGCKILILPKFAQILDNLHNYIISVNHPIYFV